MVKTVEDIAKIAVPLIFLRFSFFPSAAICRFLRVTRPPIRPVSFAVSDRQPSFSTRSKAPAHLRFRISFSPSPSYVPDQFFFCLAIFLHSFSLHFCFIQSVDTFFRPYTSLQTAMSNPLRCLLIAEELLRSLSFHPCFRNPPGRNLYLPPQKNLAFEIRSGFPFRFFKSEVLFLYFYSMFLISSLRRLSEPAFNCGNGRPKCFLFILSAAADLNSVSPA